jgi:hypothetical protein
MENIRHQLPTVSMFEYLLVINQHESDKTALQTHVALLESQLESLEYQLSRSIPINFTKTEIEYFIKSALLTNEVTSRIFHFGDHSRPLTGLIKMSFKITNYTVIRPAKRAFSAIKGSIGQPFEKTPFAPDTSSKEVPRLMMKCAVYNYKTVPKTWLPSPRKFPTTCIIGTPTTPVPVVPVFPLGFFLVELVRAFAFDERRGTLVDKDK